MPFVEVFTREPLSDDTRAKLAQSLSNTVESVEFGSPSDPCRLIDWMWFHTLPANMWAVGGRFDDTFVRGRQMALARIIVPEGLMNDELKAKALYGVAKCLREALGVGPKDDATGIMVQYVEIGEKHWLIGDHVTPVHELYDHIEHVSQERKDAIQAKFAGQAKAREAFGIPF